MKVSSPAYCQTIHHVSWSNTFKYHVRDTLIYRVHSHFNNYFVGLALQGKAITVFGTGEQKRNVLYVNDAVTALIKAACSDHTDKETFFAVSDTHYSVADIARATVAAIGGSFQLVEWPQGRKAIDVGNAVISNAKIKSLLTWEPCVTLENGLAITRDYFQTCLDKYLF